MQGKWTLIATWGFSYQGICAGADMLRRGGDAESAAECTAIITEDDPAVDSVGFGGWPNINGEMELDAAMMRGRDMALGCVLGIRNFKNPVSVARLIMNRCKYNVLAGQGVEDFAQSMGCRRADMLSEDARHRWEMRLREMQAEQPEELSHDTIGVLALDQAGDIVAATSTSGLSMKLRGRVGDSPLVGSGFYADNDAGAAAATGMGEDIMRGCVSFTAVELMRQGLHPKAAAEQAVLRAHRRLAAHGEVGNIAVVCLDRQGRFGGAANHAGFSYAVAAEGLEAKVVEVEKVGIIYIVRT